MFKSLLTLLVLSAFLFADESPLLDVPKNKVGEKIAEAWTELSETVKTTEIRGTEVQEHAANAWTSTKEKSKELGTVALDKGKQLADSAKDKALDFLHKRKAALAERKARLLDKQRELETEPEVVPQSIRI